MRKPTDPPRFDPDSPNAAKARIDVTRTKPRPKPAVTRRDPAAEAVIPPQRVGEPAAAAPPPGGAAREPEAVGDDPMLARTPRPTPPPTARPPTTARPPSTARPAATARPATTTRPDAGDPSIATETRAEPERPAATSISWPSGDGTNPVGAPPDAPGVAPPERWTDPWGDPPVAPRPRPTSRQVDPWAEPPAAPRPQQEAPIIDEPLPSPLEGPPETDPPPPTF